MNIINRTYRTNTSGSILRIAISVLAILLLAGSVGSVNAQEAKVMVLSESITPPLNGDLNNNGLSADAGDLVLIKRASIGEIDADSRYDLNNNGQNADAGDLVLMKRASIGEQLLSQANENTTLILSEELKQKLLSYKNLDLNADQDADGLRNGFEIVNLQLNTLPDKADTDSDGISDANEDTDGDGLTNKQEQDSNTDPHSKDSDSDGSGDGEEVNTHKTDPAKSDTDGDGLMDGLEVELGTDPLLTDSNNNGITDDREPLQFTINDPQTGVQIDVRGGGNLKKDIVIAPLGSDDVLSQTPGFINAVDIQNTDPALLQEATISMPYDPAQLGDTRPEDLLLVYFDEELRTFIPLTLASQSVSQRYEALSPAQGTSISPALANQSVDRLNNRVSGKTTHLSKFVLVNKTKLTATFSQEFSGSTGQDSDKDGLSDAAETKGMRTGTGLIITSKPDDPDSDNDGLTDGEEMGTVKTSVFDSIQYSYYTYVSNPNSEDSDNDKLSDGEEWDNGFNPLSSDSDNDLLSDFEEEDLGTDALERDTDGDKFDDRYEDENRDQGYDPLVFTEKYDNIKEFVLEGFLLGDFVEIDTVPQLTGNIISSLVPLTEIRDIPGSLLRRDWVGTGANVISLITTIYPLVGEVSDVSKIEVKVAQTLAKNPEKIGVVYKALLNNIPEPIVKQLLKQEPAFKELIEKGFTEDTIYRLVFRGEVNINGLADAIKGASDVPRKIPGDTKGLVDGFFIKEDGKPGWRWAEEYLRGSPTSPTLITSADKKIKRFPDVFDEATREAKEVKTGYVRFSKRIENQIRNDAYLILMSTDLLG